MWSLCQQWIIQHFFSVSSFHIYIFLFCLFRSSCLCSSTVTFLPPLPLCSSEGRWNHQMTILSVSAPALVSHPSGASVLGGRCPRAHQDLWDFPETRCHGTCPNTRGGSGRVRTLYLTQQREPWFVLQVRKYISVLGHQPRLSPNWTSTVRLKWLMQKGYKTFKPISVIRSMCLKSLAFVSWASICRLLYWYWALID